MAAMTTTIVSGPLCADAADCRLLGSALFGEELAAGDAAGLRIGVVRDAVSEDVAPEVREACEAAIEALRGGDRRRRSSRSSFADLEPATLAAILIANTERARRGHAGAAQRLDPRSARSTAASLKYRMLLPAAAIVAGRRGSAP